MSGVALFGSWRWAGASAAIAMIASVAACGGDGSDGAPAPGDDGGADATSGEAAGDDAIPPADTAAPDAPGSVDAGPSGPLVAFASGNGQTIATYTVSSSSGALSPSSSIATFGPKPSFLAVRPGATHLYAIDEAVSGRVGAYAIDRATGALTYLNDVATQGNGPAHVSVDATGKWVMVANYGDGTTAVLPIGADGRLGDATDTRKVGMNAHMIVADPSNRYVFVPCLGSDYVAQLRFDAAKGTLTPNTPPYVSTATGAGPRHIAFHPGGKLVYLVNEKASTLTALSLDLATGLLHELDTVSTLPAGYAGKNTAAEVWVHPSGKLVYASNRGDDSIAVFSIDETTGRATIIAHTKTGGMTPRDFTLDPAGAYLYAANQDSGTITSFAVAPQGTLAQTGAPVLFATASFIGLVHLPAP